MTLINAMDIYLKSQSEISEPLRITTNAIVLKLHYIMTHANDDNKGCYIATIAYGDYDHPQVIILRQFRDNILNKTVLGRWFIKSYYKISPQLVEILKDRTIINSLIKKSLNQFIKLIK